MSMQIKLDKILDWKNNKPNTNSKWAKDLKEESLDLKYNYQLREMETSHESKIPSVDKDLDKFERYPDVVRYELEQRIDSREGFDLEGKTKEQFIEDEFQSQFTYYKWKKNKLEQSVERIKKEIELRDSGYLVPDKDDEKKLVDTSSVPEDRVRKVLGTTLFVDFGCGTPGNGTTATCTGGANDSYNTLDAFTEVARSAGDIAVVRGSLTQTVSSDLTFTSDGTNIAPITIKRDYGDDWSDHSDISGTATATFTFGSKTVTFTADVSGVLAAGDWIYNSTDDSNLDFSYEVKSVVTTTVTLYLPFKGTAGASKTVINMGDNPIWNTAAGNFQWNFDGDNFWKVQGLHVRGTDNNGQIELDGASRHVFKDLIFTGSSSDTGLEFSDSAGNVLVDKSRWVDNRFCLKFESTVEFNIIEVNNSYADLTGQTSTNNFLSGYGWNFKSNGLEVEQADHIVDPTVGGGIGETKFRNLNITTLGTSIFDDQLSVAFSQGFVSIEDYDNTIGDNRMFDYLAVAEGTPRFQSETTKVRSGGSAKSIKVTPASTLSTSWEFGKSRLFEIPFYATTASKTYTVFFASDDNTDWDADPTAGELWIELEYWGHASNNYRRITKSTGTVDFSTDTDFDQSLAITIAPSQAGVAYLRCYYAKPKEATNANLFYVDPIPVVT